VLASGLLLKVLLASGIPRPAPYPLYGVREFTFLAYYGLVFLYDAIHPVDALANPGAVLSYKANHPADALAYPVPVFPYDAVHPANVYVPLRQQQQAMPGIPQPQSSDQSFPMCKNSGQSPIRGHTICPPAKVSTSPCQLSHLWSRRHYLIFDLMDIQNIRQSPFVTRRAHVGRH
jgi:hypothetical protein